MKTVVAIHQPNYLPWIGFFHKIFLSNKFVFLDNVPFTKNGFQNRSKIKTQQRACWITVPVLQKGLLGQISYDVQINNKVEWRRKHWNTMYINYRKAPFFTEYAQFFEDVYKSNWNNLLELNLELLKFIMNKLDIETETFLASQLDCSGKGTDLLLDICKKLSADVYISGSSGRKYLTKEKFENCGIEVKYHNFVHPVYNQLYGEFISNLSIVDLLFNCGKSSRDIIKDKAKGVLVEK